MAQITLKGNPINAVGDLPEVGAREPDYESALAAVRCPCRCKIGMEFRFSPWEGKPTGIDP